MKINCVFHFFLHYQQEPYFMLLACTFFRSLYVIYAFRRLLLYCDENKLLCILYLNKLL